MVPFPRAIDIGTVGRDVLAVKRCLHRLHYGSGMNWQDATYGAGSKTAMSLFLKSHGYPTASGAYGRKAHAALSPHMDLYERKLMAAVYTKLRHPATTGMTHRQIVVRAARLVYDHRYHHHYTQGGMRWQGINSHLRYPHYPDYSDCSSFATWCYWLAIGNGPDILNGMHWAAGNTGSQIQHGRRIARSDLQPADLVFYGSPVGHVAVYVGGGRVVSHGHDPVGLYSVGYRTPTQCRSYL